MNLWMMLVACQGVPESGLTDAANSSAEVVEIAAGTFQMGRPDAEPGDYGQSWKENEMPMHEVSLSAFAIDKTEVTATEWANFLNGVGGDTHHYPLQAVEWDGERFSAAVGKELHPITYVNWYDATVFCAWAGKRLPTEAEWERVAKGPSDEARRWPWPEGGPTCANSVHYTNHTLCEPAPVAVGSRSPDGDSEEGVQDLAGNVAEWVADWYTRYDETPQTDPRGPSTGVHKILRGGGFREARNAVRTMARTPADPARRSEGVGFRCAISR